MKRVIELRKYLTRLFLFLLLLQLGILGGFEIYHVSNTRRSQREALHQILLLYKNNIENVLTRADQALGDILSERALLQVFWNESELQRWHASRELLEVMEDKLEQGEQADAYVIANDVYQSFIMKRSSRIGYGELEGLKEFFFRRFDQPGGDSGWLCASLSQDAYLIHYYRYNHVMIGAVISMETLRQMDGSGNSVFEFTLYDRDNQIAYSSLAGEYGEAASAGDRLAIRDQVPVYRDNYVLEGVDRSAGMRGMETGLPFLLVMTVFALIMISIMATVIFHQFVKSEISEPLGELVQVTEAVKNGEWDKKAELHCKNKEFLELQDAYNRMLETIVQLKVEKYERIIRLKDSELKYRHMQLKPHFFLNVLSTVNSLTYQHRDEEIRRFIQALSGNIRYMFRTGLHTVRLCEEMKALDNYLEIQKLLYHDCFYFYIDVEAGAEDWPVPQMIIHTFAENVFKHVIALGTFTTVFLQCRRTEWKGETMLRIVMENDGKCLPAEVISRTMETEAGEELDSGHGVGLSNIRKVLMYMYDRTDLMILENEGSDRARITVYVPAAVSGREDFA
ncbi:MAG: histidine kinase [Eubacteriales bacterium]|nr:histidine kinase [Eubacteriales bacterium]